MELRRIKERYYVRGSGQFTHPPIKVALQPWYRMRDARGHAFILSAFSLSLSLSLTLRPQPRLGRPERPNGPNGASKTNISAWEAEEEEDFRLMVGMAAAAALAVAGAKR